MAPPRQLVDQEHAACYHVTSRCVRRAWLCGYDPFTRRNYSHRRRWVTGRMADLERFFAVEILGHAVVSTHFHMVLRYDPGSCETWSDEEVARRWVEALPVRAKGRVSERRKARKRDLLIKDPEGLARARRSLGSLPDFMKHLKQPIARRANLEDGCEGHFFERRFYCGALLSEEALLASMVYVDLDPAHADQVREWIDCRDTAIGERVREHTEAALEKYLGSVAPGLEGRAPGATAPAPPTVACGAHAPPVTYPWEARSRHRRRKSSGQ